MPDTSSSDSGIWPPVGGGFGPFGGIPWRAQLVSAGFIVCDFLGVVLAYLLAGWLYLTPLFQGIRLRTTYDPTDLQMLGLAMGLLLVLVFGALGLYRRGVSVLNVEEDVLLLKGLVFSAVTALALSFVIRDRPIPRIALVLALFLMVPLVILGRRMVRGLSSWLVSVGVGSQIVAIYGAGDTGRQLADRLLRNPQFGLRPVCFIDDDSADDDRVVFFGPGRKKGLMVAGTGERLVEVLKEKEIKLIFLAMPRMSSERLGEVQEQCKKAGIGCHYVPLFTSGPFRRFSITFVGDMPLVSERAPSYGMVNRLGKRIFDVIISGLLLVAFSWLFGLVALLLRIYSKGPVFFHQERVGQRGRTFRMHKFRSMHVSSPAYAQKPESGRDPRIFALGRLLRKSSLDELPQLWNVFKGEMSLVGPRPEMPYIVEKYNAVQGERFNVLPGMTGLWQVSADRNLPIHENTDYDLYYIYNHSFLLDLVILVRTVFAMFSGH